MGREPLKGARAFRGALQLFSEIYRRFLTLGMGGLVGLIWAVFGSVLGVLGVSWGVFCVASVVGCGVLGVFKHLVVVFGVF